MLIGRVVTLAVTGVSLSGHEGSCLMKGVISGDRLDEDEGHVCQGLNRLDEIYRGDISCHQVCV